MKFIIHSAMTAPDVVGGTIMMQKLYKIRHFSSILTS